VSVFLRLVVSAVVLISCGACGRNPAEPTAGSGAPVSARSVTTADSTCAFALSSAQDRFGADGGAASISIDGATGCAWAVAADVPWITISGGTNFAGSGSGAISYIVAKNDSTSGRTGSIAIGTQRVVVVQSSAGSPPPPAPNSPSPTGGGRFAVTFNPSPVPVTPSCFWTQGQSYQCVYAFTVTIRETAGLAATITGFSSHFLDPSRPDYTFSFPGIPLAPATGYTTSIPANGSVTWNEGLVCSPVNPQCAAAIVNQGAFYFTLDVRDATGASERFTSPSVALLPAR
jgi:hypothetical protein